MLVTGGRDGGRPPDEFKRRMAAIASRETALAFLEECADGKHGPRFAIQAQEYAADRGYGKVEQPIGGGDKPLKVLVVRSVEDYAKSE
jgi:hypothetical protein